jgi:hypothetical protein
MVWRASRILREGITSSTSWLPLSRWWSKSMVAIMVGAVAPMRRDRMLGPAGYRVLRVEGELVMADLSRAVSIIVDNLG